MSRYRRPTRRDYTPTPYTNAKPDVLRDPRGETHERIHFDNSNEFASWFTQALAARRADPHLDEHHYSRYDGPQRVLDGVRYLREGDATDAAKADDLLESFVQDIAVQQYVWDEDVAGSVPDIPLAIAGVPEHMLTLEVVPNDHSPLRVWVGLTSSSGVSESQLQQRGIVLAAFAMAMQEVRPVWITPYVNMGWAAGEESWRGRGVHTSIISWDVQTSPLVISELLGCTSKPEVTRYVGICACNLLNPYTDGSCSPVLARDMRDYLGAAPDDLILPPIHLYDPMLTDPVKWVNDMVARYTNPTNPEDDYYNDPNR